LNVTPAALVATTTTTTAAAVVVVVDDDDYTHARAVLRTECALPACHMK